MNNGMKVYCMFEQSGTFKTEFEILGYEAYDVDIENTFSKTDYQINIFDEIEACYQGKESFFDRIKSEDLIMAFFPCTYFSTLSQLCMRHSSNTMKKLSLREKTEKIIKRISEREYYYSILLKLYTIVIEKKLRLIIENPYSLDSYLKNIFIPPTFVDKNRMIRGDYVVKPTAYWFINIDKKNGCTHQEDKAQLRTQNRRYATKGQRSIDRSLISSDYAKNFIHDFILGDSIKIIQTKLF